MHVPCSHGLITIAIGIQDRIIVACDGTDEADGNPTEGARAVELDRGFVVGFAGLKASADGNIDVRRDIFSTFHPGDTAEVFLQRYDRLHRRSLERFFSERFRLEPDTVLRECFCPLTPPQSLIVCETVNDERRVTVFEYIPTLTTDNLIVLTPLLEAHPAVGSAAFGAVGAAAPFIDLLDREYIDQALRGPRGPEHAARTLVEQAISRTPSATGTIRVQAFAARGETRPRRHSRPPFPARPAAAGATAAAEFPPVDTKNAAAVEEFVAHAFASLYPNARMAWLPRIFSDVVRYFSGQDPDYAAIDLRYHDLEHTLQATVCVTLLLQGRHLARATPKIDAHHFELAIVATLLHDSGYLKLRSDTRGTGAKYTFCHVLRSCAFAASYLPNIGASGADVETVMSAINCTGPMNEISRLRFQAPVDEIIGCAVATADYLGQMAAADYPDELEILYEEFQESDDFLHIPVTARMFKSAHDLAARTPHFWHRYVLPKLESDFHGVYRFLAQPYPTGRNRYIEAVERNIVEIQRRLADAAQPARAAAAATTPPPAATAAPSSPPV